MDAITLLALSKTKITKEDRASIAPGKYEIDTTLHIKGTVTVSKDEEYTPTTSVPTIGLMCLAMKRMGIQREQFMSIMQSVMQDNTSSDDVVSEFGIEEMENQFRAMMGTLPKATRAGKTTAKLVIE